MRNRRVLPLIVYIVLLVVIFSWSNNLFGGSLNQMPYSQVLRLFQLEQVKAFEVEDKVITMELHTPIDGEDVVSATLADPEGFYAEMHDLLVAQQESGILRVDLLVTETKPIGFSIYQIDTPESDWCKRPGWGFIREFYVAPACRLQGFGGALAAHSEKQLRNMGAEHLYLTADDGIPFWKHCGWQETEEISSNDLRILEK